MTKNIVNKVNWFVNQYKSLVVMAVYAVIYLIVFGYLENRQIEYNIINLAIDRRIPFCEYFVIPYFVVGFLSVVLFMIFLRKVMPKARIKVFLEQPADIFSCIQDFDKIETECSMEETPDVFIALDCEKTRLGAAETLFDKAKKKINIDHHISNASGCGDVNYVVPTASSASELIYDVIDKEYMDEEIAKAIYIGIIHDTGIFQYSNTSKKTLQIAGELIAFGFDFPTLIDETFYEKTYVQNQILDIGLGFGFVEAMIQFTDSGFDLCQQINCDFFNRGDLLLGQIRLAEKVKHGQLLITGETFPYISLLLLIQVIGQLHQFVEDALNLGPVLFVVVLLDDGLVAVVVIQPLGIAGEHLLNTFGHKLGQILDDQMGCCGLGEFPVKEVKVDFGDVEPLACLVGRRLQSQVVADDAVDLHHQIGIVGMSALGLEFPVDGEDGIPILHLLLG